MQHNNQRPAFAKWFREEREKRGLTQEETATALDVASPTISRWENGAAEPRASQLERLRRWADVDAARLLRLLAA